MTWQAPGALELLLLGFAAFRFWKLLADDAITARLRWRLLGVRDDDDLPELDDPLLSKGERRQAYVATLVRCPWCLGSHVALAWWLAWCAWPHGTLVAAGALAVMAAVGVLASVVDRLQG